MDSYEAAQLVFARVKLLEPEHVTKIMGYLLLQDHTNTEMFSLAFCTDADLKEAVARAKKHVLSSPQQQPADQQMESLSTSSTRNRSSKGTDFVSKEENKRPNPSRKPGKEHRFDNAASAKAPEDAALPCKYFFARGYCKLGASCRFMHDGEPPVPDTSRQLYLTFPSESRFTEKDVLLYFSAYGPVEEVRIPAQSKRMFGFIAFQHPETVRAILNDSNPHYICGARVLVKPYREKTVFKSSERKKSRDTDTGESLIGSDAVRRAEEERAQELERRRLLTDARVKAAAIAAAKKTRALSGKHQAYMQSETLKSGALGPVNYLYPLLSNGHSYSGPLVKPVGTLPDFGDPCCICYELFVEPIQLDCSHTFCIPCILKAVKSSDDECPICHSNISDQVYKMLHATGEMQPWLSSPPPPPTPAAASSAAGFTSLLPLATDNNGSIW